MRITINKENELLMIDGKKRDIKYSFSIEASGITTKEDVQEIIHQCRLVESHLDELNNSKIE